MQPFQIRGKLAGVAAAVLLVSLISLPACTPGAPSAGGPKVVIRYSATTADHISDFKPAQGYIYLILSLDIENNGYSEFSLNPSRFYVWVNRIAYDVALVTFPDELKGFGLPDGYRTKGKLVFEVPETVSTWGFEPGYADFFGRRNIEWIKEQTG